MREIKRVEPRANVRGKGRPVNNKYRINRRLRNVNTRHPLSPRPFLPFVLTLSLSLWRKEWRIRLTFHSIPRNETFLASFRLMGFSRPTLGSRASCFSSFVDWRREGGRDVAIICFSEILEIFAGLFESYWRNGVDDGRFEEVTTCGLAFSKDFLLVSIVHFVLTILLILRKKGI